MNAEIRIDPDGWDPAVADTDGPQLVVAGPGAGKTEFLVRRAAHLVTADGIGPDRILVLSFSRRTVADLRRRLGRAIARSVAGIPASTFHSLAMRLVEAHAPDVLGWPRLPTLLTGPEQVALVGELLSDEDPAPWPLAFRGLLGSPAFAAEVTDFLLRCREHLISPDELARRAASRDDWDGLAAFLARYDRALEDRGRIDYGSLQASAVALLRDATVADAVAEQFSHVLVDEYQDTTVAQAALLQGLTARHRNLTVAGDPYQSIYSFRGASVDNIARFPDEFRSPDGTPARRIVLTTSFRVPGEILDAAVSVTAGGHLPGAAGPVVAAPGSGTVEAHRFDQQTHEAEWIAGQLERWHRRDAIPYSSMAVLVRSTRRLLPELSRALARRGIPHDEPDRRLVDHPAARIVFDLVRASLHDPADRRRALRRLLLGPLGAMPLGAWRDLERRADGDGDWDGALRAAGQAPVADLIADASWAKDLPAADGFWHAWSSIPAFVPVAEGDRGLRSAWASLGQVLGRLRERDASTSLARFLAWSEAEDFEATPLLEFSGADGDRLTLTTLHQAKGRAFDVVVIADAVDGVFPDLRRRETLLQVRHLAADQPQDAASWAAFRLQEEMRLAYTAMTRAARRVVWTTTTVGDETGHGTPSRFITMIFGSVPEVGSTIDHEPVTPMEAEAWLQRITRDPLEPSARRLAAARHLAAPAEWRARSPEAIAGVAPRGPDTGLAPEPVVLSPSQADAYRTCPRRYALERRLLVDAGRSPNSALGSVVHAVLETVERRAGERGDDRSTLEEALAALDSVWEPGDFGGGEWAQAWHDRAAEILGNLYGNWPGTGSLVDVEVPVEIVRDGVRWRGRLDRIERTADGLVVVDYKTSRSVASIADAGGSIQLGFYVLAARESFDEPVSGAEFWYPASLLKRGINTRSFDLERLDEVEEALDAAAAGIAEERWDPRPSAECDRCAVRWVCPVWPEGQEAFSR